MPAGTQRLRQGAQKCLKQVWAFNQKVLETPLPTSLQLYRKAAQINKKNGQRGLTAL